MHRKSYTKNQNKYIGIQRDLGTFIKCFLTTHAPIISEKFSENVIP